MLMTLCPKPSVSLKIPGGVEQLFLYRCGRLMPRSQTMTPDFCLYHPPNPESLTIVGTYLGDSYYETPLIS